MSFTFNNLNCSSKSDATAACSTNSPLKSNLNTDDIVKNIEDKSNLNIDRIVASGSKSNSNNPLFIFGNNDKKKNVDLKTTEGFNFVFNSNSFGPSPSRSNTELKVVGPISVNSSLNNLFDNKQSMEPELEDKNRAAELDCDNNNENSSDNSNENSIKDEKLDNQEQRQDDKASNEDTMVVKTLVKEFQDVIHNFVKERIEGEKKIAALEGRMHILEEEVQNLKKADSKQSPTVSATKNNDTAMSMVNSVSQQSLEQPSIPISQQIPSPLIPTIAESSALKKSTFGSTSSLFGTSSAALFDSASTNSFGPIASSLLGSDSTPSLNFVPKTSLFNHSVSTQNQGGSQLFGASMQTIHQNGKNLAPDQKKEKPKKLFTHEAVTSFLNAQKDPSMNNLTKINTGNPLKKMANGQECSEQNQSTSTKEEFQTSLQRTIEMSVKKCMEEYWGNSNNCNSSENNFKKFNNGNMF